MVNYVGLWCWPVSFVKFGQALLTLLIRVWLSEMDLPVKNIVYLRKILYFVLTVIYHPSRDFFDYTLRSLYYCQSTASNFDVYSAHSYGHSLACHTYCDSEPVTFTPIAKRLARTVWPAWVSGWNNNLPQPKQTLYTKPPRWSLTVRMDFCSFSSHRNKLWLF